MKATAENNRFTLEQLNDSLEKRSRTSCEHCVFATREGGVQVGCRLGRTRKFLEKGARIELVLRPDGSIHHLIHRVCTCARTSVWGEKIPRENWKKEVRNEITLQFHAIVYADSPDYDATMRTVESLAKQQLPPKTVQIVLNYDDQQPAPLVTAMKNYTVFDRWFVATQAKEVLADGNRATVRQGRGKSLDIALGDCAKPVYVVFNSGYCAPPYLLSSIDYQVNDELEQFAVLTGDNAGNSLVVIRRIHADYGGNAPEEMVDGSQPEGTPGTVIAGIENKVEYIAKITGEERLVRTVEEFAKCKV